MILFMSRQETTSLSKIFVTLQFLILSYFVLFHPIHQPFGPQDVVAWTIIIAGCTLGIFALLSFRKSSFRIVPEPNDNATLITDGPHAFIRHPMYTALILLTFGLFINYPIPSHFLAFSLLFITLNLKLTYEEKLLLRMFPRYQKYQASTHKLFPFVY